MSKKMPNCNAKSFDDAKDNVTAVIDYFGKEDNYRDFLLISKVVKNPDGTYMTNTMAIPTDKNAHYTFDSGGAISFFSHDPIA